MSNQKDVLQFCQDLEFYEPFLMGDEDCRNGLDIFANSIKQHVPILQFGILRILSNEESRRFSFWYQDSITSTILNEGSMEQCASQLLSSLSTQQILSDQELDAMFNATKDSNPMHLTMLFIGIKGSVTGIIIFAKDAKYGNWKKAEKEQLSSFLTVLNISFSNKYFREDSVTKSLVLDTIMDVMNANFYVTDIETDSILFMNSEMKKTFGIDSPETKICWKILQKGQTKRCSFCPIAALQLQKKEIGRTEPYIWEEVNSVTGRTYKNYDNLIQWFDGRTVHIQQSVDITESKKLSIVANIDELTKLLNRRAGKLSLEKEIQLNNDQIITVCMYDINNLKQVNDAFGHSEGDILLVTVARVVKNHLGKNDYSFRLSGDEFIIVFHCNKKQATAIMKLIKEELLAINESIHKPYMIDFCYGLLEISSYQDITVQDILIAVDEKMYEQKKIFHLDQGRLQLEHSGTLNNPVTFQYDKEKLYDALIQSTDDYIYVNNLKTGMFRYSPAMVKEFDLPGEIIANAAQVWGDKVHPHDKAAFLESNQDISDGRTDYHNVEYRAKNRYGEWVWMRCRGHVERDENGEAVLFAGIISNLGRNKKVDHVSGLYNKYEFERIVRDLLVMNENHHIGIMILGLDDLKHINDLYDREFGNEVIRIVVQKITTVLPESAMMYRLDGNEFAIVLNNTSKEGMNTLYKTIQKMFGHQQAFNNKKFYSTLSAGCVVYPTDAKTFEEMYRYAKHSLEWAKENGKNRIAFYNQKVINQKSHTLDLVEHLRKSIENNYEGFSLYYQMQVDAKTQLIIGAEALARWNDNGEEISPVVFIPILEHYNLIQPVGKWVFKTAVATCSQWVKVNPTFKMSINLSYLQLLDPGFIDFMQDTLRLYEVNPSNIITELTEGTFITDYTELKHSVERIRELGISIAMDDFGTGYSSLGILKDVPVDVVKIDKTFVKGIHDSTFNATFIKCIVQLCHDVGILVCLEGIETRDEYNIVYPMEIDIIQGFFFGRPQPKSTFEKQNLLLETITSIQDYQK